MTRLHLPRTLTARLVAVAVLLVAVSALLIATATTLAMRSQLAQQLDADAPIDMGTAMWKLYVNTDDCAGLHQAAVDAGYTSTMAPLRMDRWPVTIAFLADPDGYAVELVERRSSGPVRRSS